MKNKEIMFVQEYGTYSNELLVLVGVEDKKNLLAYFKKIKVNFDFSKWVLEDFDGWTKKIKRNSFGLFCSNDIVEGTVLILRPYKDTWEYWECLMHEIHHIVQHLAKKRGMYEELEAQAYLFEFLFRSIRKKLQGVNKIKL